MGYREKINLTSAVRSAARQDSNLGNIRQADYEALVGFQSVMTRAKHMSINRVVVYKATGSDGTPSNASCLTTAAVANGTGINTACNIYSNNQIQNLGATRPTDPFRAERHFVHQRLGSLLVPDQPRSPTRATRPTTSVCTPTSRTRATRVFCPAPSR